MNGPDDPTIEMVLFIFFIILACAVPLILAWAILTAKRKAKNKEAKK